MLGIFKVDQIPPPESEDPDPVELRVMTRVIVFFYAGVDAPPAPDAARKFKAVTPEGIGQSILCADFKVLPVLLIVSFFQFGDDALLLFRGHLSKMFLEKILGLLLAAVGEERQRSSGQGSQGKITDKLSSRVTFILHDSCPSVAEVEARA